MQVILGSNGVIGRYVEQALYDSNIPVRLVSRTPNRYHESNELFTADLMNKQQVNAAIKGADVAYLTAGLQYRAKTWVVEWPLIMQNVLDACIEHGTRLVFFDNVYCYGEVEGWMKEDTPIHPTSDKGKIRARLLHMIWEKIDLKQLQAMIVRSADFYGPNTPNSITNILVFDKFKKGKKAQWLLNDEVRHSFTYTPDAGKATALLGNTLSAYNQVWHLPTDQNVLTGKQFIIKVAEAMGVKPQYQVLPKWMLSLIGLFVLEIRESMEMLYQNEFDYLFDSQKFQRAFPDFKVTTYDEGIRNTVASLK